ncbi:MAG TPA: response regulator, partial [Ktedonobacterales bacterium]|nr:response regulator [Ktedonobacterales bacterium]
MRILVADDDRDQVDLLTYWLKGNGYDMVRAFDGEQAVQKWRETKPDLVILDVEMPKLDGFEVCRRMSGESNALVLFLTCREREVDEVRALDLGGDDYLRKPFSARQLLARIRALIRRARTTPRANTQSVVSVGPISLDS